jgi:thiamine monophosphate synthase
MMHPNPQSLRSCASLILPPGNSAAEREQFRSDYKRALDNGNTTFLVWASNAPNSQGVEDLRKLVDASHKVCASNQDRVRCLIVDNILLAKKVRADGVIFSKPPGTSYARAREVLGSHLVIGRLIPKTEVARIYQQEAHSDQIDFLIYSEDGVTLQD